MTERHATYVIREIADFLAVPSDRIDNCLKEFSLFLRVQPLLRDLIGAPTTVDAFEWTDDGEQSFTITIDGASK